MCIWSRILIFSLAVWMVGCGSSKPATPRETFITYTKAIAKKDTATMKVLLSSETIKMHEQQAKSLGVTVDEIVQREDLFSQNQKLVEFRDEKIDGSNATLQVKNKGGRWENVPFVMEDGAWKIDKAGYVNKFQNDVEEEQNKVFDQLSNTGAEPQLTP